MSNRQKIKEQIHEVAVEIMLMLDDYLDSVVPEQQETLKHYVDINDGIVGAVEEYLMELFTKGWIHGYKAAEEVAKNA